MARRKRNVRSVAKTLLIYGEGKTERAFCLFLKDLLVKRNSGVKMTIGAGNGGGPIELMRKVQGKLERMDFDNCVVLMDTDLPWPKSLPKRVNKTRIHYAGAIPCIEGLFLKLLNDPKYHSVQHSSQKCKRHFHKKYLGEEEKYDKDNYHKIFKKQTLLKQIREIPDFARLLDLMGVGKCE